MPTSFELLPELLEVEDLAVEDDPDVPGLVDHRLKARLAEVDEGEPHVPVRGRLVRRTRDCGLAPVERDDSGAVRPPMADGVEHGPALVRADRRVADDDGEAAHQR